MIRTPAEHRDAVATWRAEAPANDSDIFPRMASDRPRHGALAEGLAPLLAWLHRPEGADEPETPIVTVAASTWSIVPDNDNCPPQHFHTETDCRITPSIEEIERALAGVEVVYRKEPKRARKQGKRQEYAVPIGGDIDRNQDGSIVRMGTLHFSDGGQFERVSIRGAEGKVSIGSRRMPRGSMLWTAERSTRESGASSAPDASNAYFADVLGTAPARYLTGTGKARNTAMARLPNPPLPPTSLSYSQAREFAGLPPAERDMRPALPAGSPNVADSFIGLKKTTCGKGGSQAWQDIGSAMVDKEIWQETVALLASQDREVLDAVRTARNLREVGESLGYSGEYARKAGKKALISANDNLKKIMKKAAA